MNIEKRTNTVHLKAPANFMFRDGNMSLTPPFEKVLKWRMEDEGCVIVALESAFGVKTAETERIARFVKLDRFKRQFGSNYLEDKTRNLAYFSEIHNILDLLEDFERAETPLSQALRRHKMSFVPSDSAFIQECLNRGAKVISAEPWHMQHVTSVSNLPSADKLFDLFIFTELSSGS